MKKVFSFLAVAAIMFFAASCGGSNTPAGIQKAIYTQVQKGNYEKALDIMIDNLDAKDGESVEVLRSFVDKAKKSDEVKGGLKSFEILSEEFSEDGLSATVTTKFVYGDGSEKTNDTNYVQKDGKWKLSMGK